MATDARTRLLTIEEFMAMDLGEGMHELVRGEIIEVPPPGFAHGRLCVKIAFALECFGRRTGHGFALSNDTAIVTSRSPDSVRGGDLLYYSHARWAGRPPQNGPPPIVPDLVVEVRSPSDRPGAIREKVDEYLVAGVAFVWVADPSARTLTIYRPEGDPLVIKGDDPVADLAELPGFDCTLDELLD